MTTEEKLAIIKDEAESLIKRAKAARANVMLRLQDTEAAASILTSKMEELVTLEETVRLTHVRYIIKALSAKDFKAAAGLAVIIAELKESQLEAERQLDMKTWQPNCTSTVVNAISVFRANACQETRRFVMETLQLIG
jgi:hypothetical protein